MRPWASPALALGLLGACASPPTAPPEHTYAPQHLRTRIVGVMGTELRIDALGPDEEALEAAIDAAIDEMRRVEDMMTDWRASPLTRLNDSAGSGPTVVPTELARLIARSLAVSELTDGAFDPTYAGVGSLWDFKQRPPMIPDPSAIRAGLQHVGYRRVSVDLKESSVTLPQGMSLGLGGIAKGYGVDRAMQVLIDRGIEHAMVNAGGDLKVLGRNKREAWPVAIKHPRDRERVLAVLPVSNTCVVTSGDYERFFEHEGRRYHHILDPRTGYPSTGAISVTVVAPDAAFADALATALCVRGPEALAIVEEMAGLEALLVDLEGTVHVTSGLAAHAKGVAPPGAG